MKLYIDFNFQLFLYEKFQLTFQLVQSRVEKDLSFKLTV